MNAEIKAALETTYRQIIPYEEAPTGLDLGSQGKAVQPKELQ